MTVPTEKGEQMSATDTTPIRQKSARGMPKPSSHIWRRCESCGADFLGLAPGLTGERGLWHSAGHPMAWVCSQECADEMGWTW